MLMLLQSQPGGDAAPSPAGQPGQEPAASEPAASFMDRLDMQTILELVQTYAIPVAKALIILFVAWLVAMWARRGVRAALTRARFDLTLTKFFANVARWAILVFAIIAVLGVFGVETTSFAALIAAGGLAIGLAFQGSLSNMAAGVMLLTFRPFSVGQVVTIGGVTGVVNEVELFTTQIDTFDNRRIVLPNSSVFGAVIENFSHHPHRRTDVAVGVSYDADINATRSALERAVASVENVLDEPPPQIVLTGLGASSVDWTVRAWARQEHFWPMREALIAAIKRALDDARISIPYPQMDVHVDGALRNAGASVNNA